MGDRTGEAWTWFEVADSEDARSIYDKLETVIPIFYTDRETVMCRCITVNGSFFNVHRMMQEYVSNAYFH
jgi:glycogen phosphorylase